MNSSVVAKKAKKLKEKSKKKFKSDTHKKKKKHRRSSSSSSSDSSTSSSSSDDEHRRRRKEARRLKRESKKLHKQKRQQALGVASTSTQPAAGTPSTPAVDEEADCGIPIELMNSKAKAPQTREEYEAQQSIIRRVVGDDGRTRLIKGEGEIIEEIVSKDRHKEINKQATKGDGADFQKRTIGWNF